MVGYELLTVGLPCFQNIPHGLVPVVSKDGVFYHKMFVPNVFQRKHNSEMTDMILSTNQYKHETYTN